MRRINVIFFLVLATLFCFKEIASTRILTNDNTVCVEDMSEDGQNSEEGDTDSEGDVLFSNTFEHEFCFLHPSANAFKAYSMSHFKFPYSEIQLPPPELV